MMKSTDGFSLIEFVIVLTLIGIVGALTIPYFLNRHTFDAPAAQDGFIAMVRAAQQAALGRSNITMELDSSGADWVMSVKEAGTVLRELRVSNATVVLETGSSVASASSCETAYDVPIANDFVLSFDAKGELLNFTNNGLVEPASPLLNAVRFCVNDDTALSACVAPSGYAYSGGCDE